jgi:hypothetical protein
LPNQTESGAWVEVDEQGRYLDASADALAVFDVSRDELRRHRVGDFAPPGLGPIHRALFLWVARGGEDFGGGQSTIVSRRGIATPVECRVINLGDNRYRVDLTIGSHERGSVQSNGVSSVLEAWRRAERQIAKGERDPDYDLATAAAEALREVYQGVVARKAGTSEGTTDER